MERIATGVYQVSQAVNSFVVDGDEGVTLIDTGMPRRQGSIIEGLANIGRSAKDIRAILLTHAHFDHIGGADALHGASGATVFASQGDAPAIQGDRKMQPPPLFDRVPGAKMISGWLPGVRPVLVDEMVAEGSDAALPGDFRVIDTPGHTHGHVSYLLDRNDGVLFIGDAAVWSGGRVKRGWMNRKTDQIDASIRHLAESSFQVAAFGHSSPITSHASDRFASFAQKAGLE